MSCAPVTLPAKPPIACPNCVAINEPINDLRSIEIIPTGMASAGVSPSGCSLDSSSPIDA